MCVCEHVRAYVMGQCVSCAFQGIDPPPPPFLSMKGSHHRALCIYKRIEIEMPLLSESLSFYFSNVSDQFVFVLGFISCHWAH